MNEIIRSIVFMLFLIEVVLLICSAILNKKYKFNRVNKLLYVDSAAIISLCFIEFIINIAEVIS